jgi:hypothetical protein
MASDYIGVIVGANSGIVVAVINPDDDSELDNPRLLLLQTSAPLYRMVDPSAYTLTDGSSDIGPFYEMLRDDPGPREPVTMVRVPRDQYARALSMEDVANIVAAVARR